jgi:hypothetical protein
MKTITIRLANKGVELVPANVVVGVWAAHKPHGNDFGGKGYNVTHVPSGARAVHCADLRSARTIVHALPQIEKIKAADKKTIKDALFALNVNAGASEVVLPP